MKSHKRSNDQPTGNVLFSERQYFRQIWLWVFLLCVLGFFLWALIQQLIIGKPFGSNPASDGLLIGLSFIPVLLIFFFVRLNVYSRFDQKGIFVSLSGISKFSVSWAEVESAYIREYKALREYGGWGYRISFVKKGNAYIISGNKGLQLILKNGKKVLIGTQDAPMLEQAIRKQIQALAPEPHSSGG